MRCRSVALVNAVKGPDGQRDLWTELAIGVDDPDPRRPRIISIELIPAGYLVTGAQGGRLVIPHANVRYCHLLDDEVSKGGTPGGKVVSVRKGMGK